MGYETIAMKPRVRVNLSYCIKKKKKQEKQNWNSTGIYVMGNLEGYCSSLHLKHIMRKLQLGGILVWAMKSGEVQLSSRNKE